MNNKILRKLTLSAVTLGVAALSLTTSTYAWFVSNDDVTASTVSGTTKVADSNMLISTKNDTRSGYTIAGKECVLTSVDADVNLTPVEASGATAATATFKKAGDTVGQFTTDAAATDVLHYEVIFYMSDLAANNTLTAKFKGFTGGTGTQYLLVDASSEEGGAKAGDTISVDLLDVLSLRVESSVLTQSEYSAYGISDTIAEAAQPTISENTTKYYRYNSESDTVKVNGSNKKADALTYYNNVFTTSTASRPNPYKPTYEGTALSSTKDNTLANSITLFDLTPKNGGVRKGYVKTDLYFFIDGWDKQCFSAVGGLGITAGSIEFNLQPKTVQS